MQQQSVFLLRDVNTGQENPIAPGGTRVGRTSENDIALDDDQVSRHHATLWVQNGQLYVRDEGSTNGTWVNDERVAAPRALQAGDQVRIGGTTFEVATGLAPAPVADEEMPPRASLPIVPIAISGGIVVVILVALVIRMSREGASQVTQTPTVTLSPQATLVITATPALEPTSTPVPTPPPTATPAPPPATRVVQPELVTPSHGMEYRSPITFQWNGSLDTGQMYLVTVRHPGTDHVIQSGLLTSQEWTKDLPADHIGEWRWTVSVVKDDQELAVSEEWMFWFQPFPKSEDEGSGQAGDVPTEAAPTATPEARP